MISSLLPQKKVKFFTTGFTGRDVADLKPLLLTLDAVLVDIRMMPHSPSVQWNREYLKILLGGKYRHIAQLGNRHTEKGAIMIQHLALGVRIITSFKMNVLLMCECGELQQCHRLLIARELARQNYLVEELKGWKASATESP